MFQPLPATLVNNVTTYEAREQYILKFLNDTLPASDIKRIPDEMKKVSKNSLSMK